MALFRILTSRILFQSSLSFSSKPCIFEFNVTNLGKTVHGEPVLFRWPIVSSFAQGDELSSNSSNHFIHECQKKTRSNHKKEISVNTYTQIKFDFE